MTQQQLQQAARPWATGDAALAHAGVLLQSQRFAARPAAADVPWGTDAVAGHRARPRLRRSRARATNRISDHHRRVCSRVHVPVTTAGWMDGPHLSNAACERRCALDHIYTEAAPSCIDADAQPMPPRGL
jgi:hypothetical protein